MYRQIVLHTEDRDYQRILWSPNGRPEEYQLNIVTYGLACAPYLALKVIQQLAEDDGSQFSDAASVLREDMYIDDVLSVADTIPLARSKAMQVDQLLMAGGFKLQKWARNEPSVLELLDPDRRTVSSHHEFTSDTLARALGLSWDPSNDTFLLQPGRSTFSKVATKRLVLSRVAKIFDPLGWITPVTIVAKVFIQDLWKLGVDWDAELPPSYASKWHSIKEALNTASLSIPRWLGWTSNALAVEFHGFSDSSQDALGAVIYLRVIDDLNNVRVSLVAGKSKVAPLKRVTIPRLELSAALLLAKLLVQCRAALKLFTAPAHLWTDSSVTLAWINGPPSRWKDYVANRVTLIRDLDHDARWHHAPGSNNPADCASRGLYPSKFASHSHWWSGPVWLNEPSTRWPSHVPFIASDTDLEERPLRSFTLVANSKTTWDLLERYSSLTRLLRVTGWILRAIALFKGSGNDARLNALTPSELQTAEFYCIKQTQFVSFSNEIQRLSQGEELPRSHPLLRLAPFMDANGFLRIGGRLRNSMLDPDAKHQFSSPESHRWYALYWMKCIDARVMEALNSCSRFFASDFGSSEGVLPLTPLFDAVFAVLVTGPSQQESLWVSSRQLASHLPGRSCMQE